MTFQKAVKRESKLRMSLAGPAGAGKTWTALTLATRMANGEAFAVLDTERGSASKYADDFSFDVMELDSFDPRNYVKAIKEAEEAGYSVLVIDSLTHAWNGTGGLLDIVDQIARRKYSNNTFAAWKDATPLQNQLIDAITASKLHIIVTMRSKQEYESGKNEKTGRTEVKKLGMAPIQRDGMEYEFDIVADMDIDNNMIIQKSRCSKLSGQIISKPDGKVADTLKEWLRGAPVLPVEKPAQEATPAARPSPTAPKPQASESKPAEQDKEAHVPTVSQLRALAAKHVGVGAFDAIVGVLQATYKNTNLKVDDAWQEKHCKHAYDLLKKQINEKKQTLSKAS